MSSASNFRMPGARHNILCTAFVNNNYINSCTVPQMSTFKMETFVEIFLVFLHMYNELMAHIVRASWVAVNSHK